jgi:hypothetical protein
MKDTDSGSTKLLDLNSFLSWLETEMNNYSMGIRHIVADNGSQLEMVLIS